MLGAIRKMSLRTRLALLAGFAIVALLIAAFVAWRLARATETFAVRQADAAVNAAARDLAREFQRNPNGYQTIEEATQELRERDRGPRRIPPHIESIFATYSDPFSRLTAITLHRYPEVAGGLYRPMNAGLIGYASPGQHGASFNSDVPSDLVIAIRAESRDAITYGSARSRTIQIGSDRFILVAYPATEDEDSAWAMQRLSHLSGVADWPNLTALIALALSILAVSGLALLTVRDLGRGVNSIETGLAGLTNDLGQELLSPNTAELARISTRINELAATLRANLARQAELERDLRQSERLSALGRVVAGVAHEVRNPLASIKLKVQLTRRSSRSPEKLADTMNVISAEIERLDALVRRLLELGGQQRLELAKLDLGGLVVRRAAFFNEVATRGGVVIDAGRCRNDIVIEGDENRLSQVIDNLIQNALDAMPDGGHLTINCALSSDQNDALPIQVKFADTGQGIQPTDRERIFEPFYTNRATGTGLGLAIAKAIVEEHRGRLDFVSGETEGASFVMRLPLPVPKTIQSSGTSR